MISSLNKWLLASAAFTALCTASPAVAQPIEENELQPLLSEPVSPSEGETDSLPTEEGEIIDDTTPTVDDQSTSPIINGEEENTPPIPAPEPYPMQEGPVSVPRAGDISVSQPEAISSDNVGTQSAAALNLPDKVWQGISHAELEKLIPLVNKPVVHNTVREVLTRLLLAQAEFPDAKTKGTHLLILRLNALVALNQTTEALQLMDALPAQFRTEDMERLRTDLTLLRGDVAGACKLAAAGLGQYESSYWQSVMLFCQAREGKQAEVELGLNMLSEQNDPNKLLPAITTALLDKNKPVKNFPSTLTLSDWAMLIAAEQSGMQVEAIGQAPLPTIEAVGDSKAFAPEIRALAWERAVLRSDADPAKLAEIYAELATDKAAISKALKEDKIPENVRGRAMWFMAQQQQDNPAKKAPIIARALAAYEKKRMLPLALRLFGTPMAAIPADAPVKEIRPVAFDGFRLSLSTGDLPASRKWLMMLDKPDNKITTLQRDVAQLMMTLAEDTGSAKPIPDVSLPDGVRPQDIRRLFRLYALMDALGYPLSDADKDLWLAQRVRYEVEMPSPALMEMFEKARAAKSPGKTLLLGMLLVGSDDMSKASDDVLAKVVRALNELGMKEDARTLALEAVLALPG